MTIDEIAKLFKMLSKTLNGSRNGSYKWRSNSFGHTNGTTFYTAGGEIIKGETELSITLNLDSVPSGFKVDVKENKLVFTWKNEWGKQRIRRMPLFCEVEDHTVTKMEFKNNVLDIKLVMVKPQKVFQLKSGKEESK